METKEFAKRIDRIVRPLVEDMGFELLLTEWTTDRGHPVVRLFIDRPIQEKNVNISDCTEVSRQVGALLDIEDPIPGKKYRLEVSSPGIDRPLVTPAHFSRFIGSLARVQLKKEAEEKRKRYKGIIKEVSKETLKMEVDGKMCSIKMGSIDKANLVGELK